MPMLPLPPNNDAPNEATTAAPPDEGRSYLDVRSAPYMPSRDQWVEALKEIERLRQQLSAGQAG